MSTLGVEPRYHMRTNQLSYVDVSTPCGDRTHDLPIRSRTLYPTELKGLFAIEEMMVFSLNMWREMHFKSTIIKPEITSSTHIFSKIMSIFFFIIKTQVRIKGEYIIY